MDEPLRCEVRRCANCKRSAALALQHSLGSIGDAVERVACDSEIGAARLGYHQPLPEAIEKFQSELGLECFHLMTDAALGDTEFLSGPRAARVPCRSLE